MSILRSGRQMTLRLLACGAALFGLMQAGHAVVIPDTPLGVQTSVPPMLMLVAGRDHRFFYEAYNDASDLDGDGALDIHFKPSFAYYGLFDSTLCYTHSGSNTNSDLFSPAGTVNSEGKCPGKWSGNWLNWATTARMDAVRKVLYGGYRDVDTDSSTVLRRAYVPQDAHSWAKEYTSEAVDGYNIADYTPFTVPTNDKKDPKGTVRRHFFGNLTRNKTTNCATLSNCSGLPPVISVVLNSTKRVWGWASTERPVLDSSTHGGKSMTDYTVRVAVCTDTYHGTGCKQYLNGHYKPFGILHEYGENDAILFGLITGSYDKNMSGGRLREVVSSFRNEVNLTTGQFNSAHPIVSTFDNIRIRDFNNGRTDQAYKGGWYESGPMTEAQFPDWGNPIGEMMYEALRYYSGKKAATSAYAGTTTKDAEVGLSSATWDDPYDTVNSAAKSPWCSKANILTLSDTNVSFDSDQLPGVYSGFGSFSGDLTGLNVSTEANTISANEPDVAGKHFIGQSGATSDNVPTAKSVASLSSIRGLAPEEPTKQGSYYAASVAYFGKHTDLRTSLNGKQSTNTFVLALASPLPRIAAKLPNGSVITLVPFAKSVDGMGISHTKGNFQPTNQIVDFYVEQIVNSGAADADSTVNGGRYYAKFNINFEDSEQGADHDMDVIVEYEVAAQADNTLKVTLTPTYQAGSIKQAVGYVVSGSTKDGPYLVVEDEADSTPYFLNVPDTLNIGDCDVSSPPAACKSLPYVGSSKSSVRTFSASTSSAATLLKDPLWYAAKWGGFSDSNSNDKPDMTVEWDADGDGVPDTYFYAQNPAKLADSLKKAFDNLINRDTSSSNVTTNSTSINSGSMVYQAVYNSQRWSGDLIAYPVTTAGVSANPAWNEGAMLPAAASRNIFYRRRAISPSEGIGRALTWGQLDTTEQGYFDGYLSYLNYVRGDRSQEVLNGGVLRDRGTYPVGDIVNSSPVYVPELDTVFVGGNDGMLHAVNGTSGVERFAFIPAEAMPNLKGLTQVGYTHRYYVDGDIAVSGRTTQTGNHNYLFALLGRGGKGLFALDVTDPTAFAVANSLWEYTPTGSTTGADDTDLGYMVGRPLFVKMNNGSAALVAGNGYNSSNGHAVLYIFFIGSDGSLTSVKKIDTGASGDNGLSAAAVYDTNGDGAVDAIYAGDLKGNVWKFDVSSSNPSAWGVAYSGSPLFVAKDSANNVQPITAPLAVAKDTVADDPHYGQVFVFVGTGSYFQSGDPANQSVQTWYGLVDDGAISSRSALRARTITDTGTFDGSAVRTFSAATAGDMTGRSGWYIDFTSTTQPGERIVTESAYYALAVPVVFASSIIPSSSTDQCFGGGTGYLNVVGAFNGAATTVGVLNVNGNSSYTDDTLDGAYIGSIDLGIGMPGKPTLIGGLMVVGGSGDSTNPDSKIGSVDVNLGVTPLKGRISWREIVGD